MSLKILHGFGWKDEFVRERVLDYIVHDFKKYKSTRQSHVYLRPRCCFVFRPTRFHAYEVA